MSCSTLPKRVSAGAFDRDSASVVVADRFGDVYRIPLSGQSVWPLLGHFCSIITSLIVLSDGERLLTSDRDGVTRMSRLPKEMTQGAVVIDHFFMGHSKFITSAIVRSWNGRSILITGGGDGRILFFDIDSGRSVGKCELEWSLFGMEHSSVPIIHSLSASHTQ